MSPSLFKLESRRALHTTATPPFPTISHHHHHRRTTYPSSTRRVPWPPPPPPTSSSSTAQSPKRLALARTGAASGPEIASMATVTAAVCSLLHVRSAIPKANPLFAQHLRLPGSRRSAPASLQRLHLTPRELPVDTPSASSAVDAVAPVAGEAASATVLLDVSGMMCGGCAARVRSVLAADARVENVAVNLLAESADVRLRSPEPGAGEALAARLTQCGFPSTARRGGAAAGAMESARKWREMAARKSELLARSRGRVAFAWTLVALCCG